MKKIEAMEMEVVTGGDFLDGFLCGAGLATATTGIGAALAVASCGRVLGFWYTVPAPQGQLQLMR